MLPRPRPRQRAPEDGLATRAPCPEHPLGASDVNPGRWTLSGCETAAFSLPPQRRSHRGAVELEGFAQVDERVRPAAVVLPDPGFGLGNELRDAKVEADRVLEHGEHEPFLRLHRCPRLRGEELTGEDGLELVPAAFLGLWSAPARHAAPRCKRPARYPQRWKHGRSRAFRVRTACRACRPASGAGSSPARPAITLRRAGRAPGPPRADDAWASPWGSGFPPRVSSGARCGRRPSGCRAPPPTTA